MFFWVFLIGGWDSSLDSITFLGDLDLPRHVFELNLGNQQTTTLKLWIFGFLC